MSQNIISQNGIGQNMGQEMGMINGQQMGVISKLIGMVNGQPHYMSHNSSNNAQINSSDQVNTANQVNTATHHHHSHMGTGSFHATTGYVQNNPLSTIQIACPNITPE
jgi:hypothetical protein